MQLLHNRIMNNSLWHSIQRLTHNNHQYVHVQLGLRRLYSPHVLRKDIAVHKMRVRFRPTWNNVQQEIHATIISLHQYQMFLRTTASHRFKQLSIQGRFRHVTKPKTVLFYHTPPHHQQIQVAVCENPLITLIREYQVQLPLSEIVVC